MATAPVTLSAARKLSTIRTARWVDGPVCAADELKIWEIELADLLELVATVERAAPTTEDAAQWLRRMFYSTPFGGAGTGFDRFISANDPARRARPMSTADVPQSVLDSLVRVGTVRIPGAAPPLDRVEISHVFVLLDLRLNGRSAQGGYFDGLTGLLEFILSWLGDVASAWLGFQNKLNAAKTAAAAAGTPWTEPLTPAAIATPLAWLEDGIKGRAPIDDLLGDLDAVVLARKALPITATPIATMLSDYYTVGVPSTGAIARVDDRFPQWVTRVLPEIPHVAGTGGITLAPQAQAWLRAVIHEGITLLLVYDRSGTDKIKIAMNTPGVLAELSSPWSSLAIDTLAERFFNFLQDGLAGRPLSWPAQPVTTVAYPGYEWLPGPPPIAAPGMPTVEDLEAVAQFHLNWRQPHRPLRTTDRLWRPLRLRDPDGDTATVVPGAPAGSTRLRIDGFVDLRGVLPAAAGAEHADLLRLDAYTARASRTYRIVAVDPATRVITVDGVPSLAAASAWRVLRRPRLVLVDPFGARLGGPAASTTTVPAGWVRLDGLPDLNTVRANFDLIALGGDRARPARCYRIVAVHPTEPRVQLDGTPSATAGTDWRIPAGYADVLNPLATTLTPIADGCDAYDGLLFVVHGDAVQGSPLPFTSYSSAVNAADPVLGSSVTGNARYAVRSLRSPDSEARNYQFAVTDPDKIAQDLVAAAGRYQDGVTALRRPPPTTASPVAGVDPDGKVNIRIHIGNTSGTVAGSTGDLVSPAYRTLRTLLVTLHQAERALLGLAADADLAAVAAASTQAASIALYNADTVTWDDRLHCELLLVRPDLRPTTP